MSALLMELIYVPFLLNYLIRKNIAINIVANGLKLTAITVPKYKIRLIDSLNFQLDFQFFKAAGDQYDQ